MSESDAVGVAALMPAIIEDLSRLTAIPSCAFPGFPAEPVLHMAKETVDLLHRSGATQAQLVEVPGGYPVVHAEVPGPPGSPVVLLYAHYDVQPAPAEQGWTVDPWQPSIIDGRLYGRGAADDKSGIAIHAATLQYFNGQPPVTLRVVIEGEEETDSHLESLVDARPELFEADVFVIADGGNDEVGHPVVCTALRGVVDCTIEIRTLGQAVHSGMFGGAAPDALLALIQVLASLHSPSGDVAVPGLATGTWPGAELDESLFRSMADVTEGVGLIGSGTINSRLVTKPAITVIGLDAPPVNGAVNAVVPTARARVSLRIPPGATAATELQVLTSFLRSQIPWGAEVTITEGGTGEPFQTAADGPALTMALEALSEAFGTSASVTGSGGSIPLLNTLQKLRPDAEFVIWGAEDARQANIHSADESVDLVELQHAILAQVLFLQRLGEAPGFDAGTPR